MTPKAPKASKAPPGECPCCGKILRRYRLLGSGSDHAVVFRYHTAPCGMPCTPDVDPELHTRDCVHCLEINTPPPPAQCPCCDKQTPRVRSIRANGSARMQFKPHKAPCGLPCKLPSESFPGEQTHVVTDECPRCQSMNKVLINGQVVDRTAPGSAELVPSPPTPKVPWNEIVIPPHALKMVMLRAGFNSAVAAAMMIEQLYPHAVYKSSQQKAQGTSHTKRTKPSKNKHLSSRVDIYAITYNGVEWSFFMKRNVLMTVHRNDDFDNIGPPPGHEMVLEEPCTRMGSNHQPAE